MTASQDTPAHALAAANRERGLGFPKRHVSSAPFIADVALLTGGSDKPYALGIAEALTSAGANLDFIGSNELDLPELRGNPR
ncbi:MAG: hypothetical protein ACREE6_18640, partial [Limisphaerales bacterium]